MKNEKAELAIMEIIARYQPILLLGRNTFKLKYGVENKDSVMECVFNYPYLNVILSYGDALIERFKRKEDITPYVVHEMCHVITDALYDKAINRCVTKSEINDERELLTDYIANIVLINKL